MYLLTDVVLVNYIIASGAAFLIAISINHSLSRKFVFRGSTKTWKESYINFLLIALIGFLIVTGGMYILVGIININYVLSRIIIAAVTGVWNYILNLYVNFNVAGKH